MSLPADDIIGICKSIWLKPFKMSWKKPPAASSPDPACEADEAESSHHLLVVWKQPLAGTEIQSRWKRPAAGDEPEPTEPPSKKVKVAANWKRCPESDGPLSSVAASSSSSWKKPRLAEPEVATSKPGKTVRHHVSLDAPMLSLVASTDDDQRPTTDYKKNALDPNRIARVLVGTCSCKNNCFGLPTAAKVSEVCQLWHSMSDESQYHFLSAQWDCSAERNGLEGTDGEQLAHRTTWYFAGQQVCLPALCALLGVGNKAMAKKLQGVVDQRRKINCHADTKATRPAMQRNLTSMFFLELYHQSAEDLPETLQVQHVDENISADQDGDAPVYMRQVSTEAEVFSWTPEAAIVQNIMALSTVDLSTVPVRHLPPGKPMSLFWQFQAWCEAVQKIAGADAIKVPSWSTFWRVWWDKWSYVLKFRKVSQHKECNTCHQLREKLHGNLL